MTIDRLLSTGDKLDAAYASAYRARCFVVEFGNEEQGRGIATVGELYRVAAAEQETGIEIDISTLGFEECIALSAYPGRGKTRAERVLDGLDQVLEARRQAGR